MQKPWRIRPVDELASGRLASALGVHPVTARCLWSRGQTSAGEADAFLNPRLASLRPPEDLAGFGQAVDRLVHAIGKKETIGIFGDYDVDGVTTTALLTIFLRRARANVVPRVARRDGGYGFQPEHVHAFAQAGCRVIVTVDLGTKDLDAIAAARAAGIDVIVVDHHQVPENAEHPAFALVNPHRPDSRYPFRDFASVGLGFFLAAALRTRLCAQGRDDAGLDVLDLLDLVAVGTIADLMPLCAENRILVTRGLGVLNERARPGLAALLARADVPVDRTVDEITVGWKLGPRLNAPGRLGDAAPALETLLAVDAESANRWAHALEEANRQRREIADETHRQAVTLAQAQRDRAALCVAQPGWLNGAVGIVAARLTETFARPAAVVAIDGNGQTGRGSIRSVAGIDVHRALESCQRYLLRFGGHAQAAGFTVASANLPAFAAAFADAVAEQARALPSAPELEIDAEVPFGAINEPLARELGRMAPFGPGNRGPVVAVPATRVLASRRVGDGTHLKLTLEKDGQERGAIAFGMGERDPGAGALVDVACFPQISNWQGRERVELYVHDFRPSPQGMLTRGLRPVA